MLRIEFEQNLAANEQAGTFQNTPWVPLEYTKSANIIYIIYIFYNIYIFICILKIYLKKKPCLQYHIGFKVVTNKQKIPLFFCQERNRKGAFVFCQAARC